MNKEKPVRAISIRQPYVEQILRGTKKFEYRSRPTKIRGTVYLYASLRPAWDSELAFKRLGFAPGELPTGEIVGTVEIVDCVWSKKYGEWAYKLKNPKHLQRKLKPKRQPQPCFFFPFKKAA